ncbi:MAG: DUF5615 family PIN-like protein [Panacagrimonas sp.]
MKIKLDENISVELAPLLSRSGHDVDTVAIEGLQGQPDSAVWAAAQSAGRMLITQDLDFADIRRFPPGTHHGLILLRHRAGTCRATRLFRGSAAPLQTRSLGRLPCGGLGGKGARVTRRVGVAWGELANPNTGRLMDRRPLGFAVAHPTLVLDLRTGSITPTPREAPQLPSGRVYRSLL